VTTPSPLAPRHRVQSCVKPGWNTEPRRTKA